MTQKLRIAVCLAILGVASAVNAQQEKVPVASKPSERNVDTRLGVGLMASPGLFGMSGSVELRVDRFFSLGPMLQLGVDSTEQIFVPTLNARFILPTSVMRENVSGWPPLELSLHTGFGVISHNDDGFRRTAVAYQAGLNADYYLMDELTVGLGASVVVTGDSTEKSVALMDASAAYHF